MAKYKKNKNSSIYRFLIPFIGTLLVPFLVIPIAKYQAKEEAYNMLEFYGENQDNQANKVYKKTKLKTKRGISETTQNLSEDEKYDFMVGYFQNLGKDIENQTVAIRNLLYKLRYATTFCQNHGYLLSSQYMNTYKRLFYEYEEKSNEVFESFPKNIKKLYTEIDAQNEKDSANEFFMNNYNVTKKELKEYVSNFTIEDYCFLIDEENTDFLEMFRLLLVDSYPTYLD